MSRPLKPQAPTANGRALHRSDAELERLSRVTHADVVDARDLWHRTAPERFRDLIDATQDRE